VVEGGRQGGGGLWRCRLKSCMGSLKSQLRYWIGRPSLASLGTWGGGEGAIEPGQLKTDLGTTPFEDWLRSRDWKKVLDRGNVGMKNVEGK
jgi:hypothetical protein